jgi:hypothetical protein
MKPARLIVGLCAALGCVTAQPATVLDFDRWMRDIDHASVSLQKRVAAGDAAAAQLDAQALATLYAQMREFFVADGNGADAVQWSEDGRQHAQAAVDAIAHQDFPAAAAAALHITRACNDCHDVYKPFNDLRKR